jgi:hypothetical protein
LREVFLKVGFLMEEYQTGAHRFLMGNHCLMERDRKALMEVCRTKEYQREECQMVDCRTEANHSLRELALKAWSQLALVDEHSQRPLAALK